MNYKVGDKVKLKPKEWLDELKRQLGDLHIHPDAYKNAGSEQTILECYEDLYRYDASSVFWHESYFEGLAEEETKPNIIEEAKTYWDSIKDAWICPQGYQFVDENGNVINATKIVLEKKKKEYPKTYEECCYVLGFENTELVFEDDYRDINPSKEQWKRLGLINQFNKLLICRDAYWKIAGEEMGLGKPWEPDWKNDEQFKYIIICRRGCIIKDTYTAKDIILAFPTEEMRDAFYENFKELIESCKELL